MSWTTDNLQRSYVCNGELLNFFRKRKGWSQQKLGDVSDISIRVVCKAEAGESISRKSIANLAAALSDPNKAVYPEDLVSEPVEICRKFVSAFHEFGYRMADELADFIEPNAEFRISGDPQRMPFAGLHVGVQDYRLALKKFFELMRFKPDFDYNEAYEYFVNGTDVVVWGKVELQLVGGSDELMVFPHRQKYRFRRGLLFCFEDHYDLGQGEEMVSKAATLFGKRVYKPATDSRF